MGLSDKRSELSSCIFLHCRPITLSVVSPDSSIPAACTNTDYGNTPMTTQGRMSTSQQLTFNLNSSDEPLGLAMRRACDRCRKRKSRCDGQSTCRSCFKVGAKCAYLIAPKPLGRRPRKQRPAKESQSRLQHSSQATWAFDESAESLSQPPLEHVASQTVTESTAPHTLPQDTPSLSSFVAQDLPSDQFNMGLAAPVDWSYPPLSLYSPSIEGGLPFDVGLLTPGNDLQHIDQESVPSSFDNFRSSAIHKPESTLDWRLPTSIFIPYIDTFFERLYPVFPVLDRASLPSQVTLSDPIHATWDQYALHTSLAAAVHVQLNLVGTSTAAEGGSEWIDVEHSPGKKAGDCFSAEFWINQALEARSQWDFMSNPSEATIMTSFFLFQYYGNKNQSQRAWYYLREAIGFALAIGLDDQDIYDDLEPKTSQRWCRLFWLLFITERAYALQHRSSAMLRSTIDLPRIFESDNPKLIYGFVSLVNLFKSVDDKFLSLWKGGRASSSEPKHPWQRALVAALADQKIDSVHEIMEIQRLDILVTQQWLHLLAWQLQTRRRQSELTQGTDAEKGTLAVNRKFPFTASRDTLQIITKANRRSLESHGIGMEQKIFDIACCLSDTLQSSLSLDKSIVSTGHQYLHGFMTLLSSFRNRESEYLQPLLAKASRTLAAELGVPATLRSPPCFDELMYK